jgi:phosphatidylglycerol:prolipoprotein diacylglycerol transferase
MHPILIQLGPLPIHTYGFLIAIGFLVAVSVIRKLSARAGLDVERVADLTFWNLLIGFMGARLLFVLTRWDYFSQNPLAIFQVWNGGLVFFGGPLAVLPFFAWYSRKFKLPVWKVGDVLVPGLAIAHAFGRLGCLAAGCCFGRPTDSDWGIKLTSDLVDVHLRGVYLHPTQIYESVSMTLLFGLLMWTFKRKRFDGQVVLMYFMTYPLIRSVIETFRGDVIRGFIIDGLLSTSQFISILVFLGATVFFYIRLGQVGRSKKDPIMAQRSNP